MRKTHDRHLAIAYGAADARALVNTKPGLAAILSPSDLDHIQYVLDAAIVNDVIKQEANDILKKSVTGYVGNQPVRDQRLVADFRRKRDSAMPLNDQDLCIRLDYKKVLTAEALALRHANPDEANYFVKVRNVLESYGIWLQLYQPFRSGGADGPLKNPRKWEIFFRLGRAGTVIKSTDGRIDREELLGNTMLGEGYSRSVLTGPMQTHFNRLFADAFEQWHFGYHLHMGLEVRNAGAPPGIAAAANWLGDTKYPPISIWKAPEALIAAGRAANTSGDVMVAGIYMFAAALLVEHNLKLMEDHVKRAARGADLGWKISAAIFIVAAITALPYFASLYLASGATVGVATAVPLAAESEAALATRFMRFLEVSKNYGAAEYGPAHAQFTGATVSAASAWNRAIDTVSVALRTGL